MQASDCDWGLMSGRRHPEKQEALLPKGLLESFPLALGVGEAKSPESGL